MSPRSPTKKGIAPAPDKQTHRLLTPFNPFAQAYQVVHAALEVLLQCYLGSKRLADRLAVLTIPTFVPHLFSLSCPLPWHHTLGLLPPSTSTSSGSTDTSFKGLSNHLFQGQVAYLASQLLGQLTIRPECIDKLVIGFDPVTLTTQLDTFLTVRTTPSFTNEEAIAATERNLQLLVTIYLITTKRHTSDIKRFVETVASASDLVPTLLGMLSCDTHLAISSAGSDSYEVSRSMSERRRSQPLFSDHSIALIARFLKALSDTHQGVGALLHKSRVWEHYTALRN